MSPERAALLATSLRTMAQHYEETATRLNSAAEALEALSQTSDFFRERRDALSALAALGFDRTKIARLIDLEVSPRGPRP